MTNKQERFLVMSEAEFEAAMDAAVYYNTCPPECDEDALDVCKRAEAACRAREVELVARNPTSPNLWAEVQK